MEPEGKDATSRDVLISCAALQSIAEGIVRAMGSEAGEAAIVATHLVEANLRGHDSHGVGMLPSYVRNLKSGALRPNRHVEFVRADGPLAGLGGGLGYGPVAARAAPAGAGGGAAPAGIALFTLRNTQHIGRVGSYAEQAVDAGMIFICFVNVVSGDPRVAAFGGSDGRMGTEPVCIGMPTGDPVRPVILDFATSQVAMGKMRVATNKGQTVGPGLLIDAAGQPTDQPAVLYAEPKGAILPFGAHKGSGLALICGLLGGALGGGGTIQPATPRDRGIVNGMFALVLDPTRLVDRPWFEQEVAALIEHVKTSPPAQAGVPVQVAGEPERTMRASRLRDGIPVDAVTWAEIRAAAAAVGAPPVPFEGKVA